MASWYYVEGSERVGPVEENDLKKLYQDGVLNEESYVWTKGYDNWEKLNDVTELAHILVKEEASAELPPEVGVNWDAITRDEKVFTIKIGLDRGDREVEYGPYNMNELQRAYDEKRINEKTFVFVSGLEDWIFLGDIPVFEKIFNSMPPVIDEIDRRTSLRKPFVARMFFHDSSEFYEGVCRDISVGGLQLLISNFPVKIGEVISMNVHPENSDYHFVAEGEIVRVLDGNQGFCLRFLELNKEAEGAISDYVAGR